MTSPHQRAASPSAAWEQRAYEHLYVLTQRLTRYDEIAAELRDNVIYVAYSTGTCEGARLERITCKPRPSDGDRLWFWDANHAPLAEADAPVAATLAVVSKLREGLPRPWELGASAGADPA